MRVAYVTLAPFISGAERSLQLMLLNCKKNNIKPIVITSHNSPIISWCKTNDINVYSLNLSLFNKFKPWEYLFAQYKLRRLLLTNQTELIHSNQIWSYRFLAPAIKELNLVAICHLRDPIGSDCAWWLTGRVNTIVCISKYIEKQFFSSGKHVQCSNIKTIINPISGPKKMTKEQIISIQKTGKAIFNIEEINHVFGFIGQIIPIKGLPDLLKALAKIKRRDWVLLIAGIDPRPNKNHVEDCRALAQHLRISKNIKFLGYLSNSDHFYQTIDLVIVPSREEPLGRVPLEGGGHYKPAIVSNAGGLPETIRENETGWVFQTGDSKQLAEVIVMALKTDLTSMGIKAKLWKDQIASPEEYMKKMKQIYNEAISEKI